MNTAQWGRFKEVFREAAELEADERSDFLDRACRGDTELRAEVESLLVRHDETAGALDSPVVEIIRQTTSTEPGTALIGKKIGGYTLKRVIGSGGMGTVYLAQQEHPRRKVALKLMKPGITSKSALRRFEFESQILGRLRHPNIAQVYESGIFDDGSGSVPYFALEYIPHASPITDYAVSMKLDTRQRLELFAKVCEAIHHGHQKGIIHRDLKPGNILVDSSGEVKIIDFGVARATDSDMTVTTLQTDLGQLIGTLQYMSPEQCDADPEDLDIRSDVYSLGVVLYEMLCGQLPYDVARVAIHEVARVIREEVPAKPSTVNRNVRGDVETITLKALEKDRERRYQSAGDLAQDIIHYLKNEPIEARPPSVIYQIRMLARRNRAVFGAIASVLVVLVIAAIVSLTFAIWARNSEHRLDEATKLPRALDELLSSEFRGMYIGIRLRERVPVEGFAQPSDARNLLVFDERVMDILHGRIVLFRDDSSIAKDIDLKMKAPRQVSTSHTQEIGTPIQGALVADVLPDEPGWEIVVAQIHRHYYPSVLRIYNLDLEPRAALWNKGHINYIFRNNESGTLILMARSNALVSHVPDLSEFHKLKEFGQSNPQVLAAIRPEDIQRVGGAHGGVLFPLRGDADMPPVQPLWMITRIPDVLAELENRYRIRAIRIAPSEPDRQDALCNLTLAYARVDKKYGVLERNLFHAHIGRDGDVIDKFVDDDGNYLTQVTGLPEPMFLKLNVPLLSQARDEVDDRLDDGMTLDEVIEHLRNSSDLTEEVRNTAIELAEWHHRDPSWLTGQAWRIVEEAGREEAQYRRAVELALRADNLSTDDAFTLGTLGIAHYRLGEYERAFRALTDSDKIKNDEAWTVVFLAMALERRYKHDEALIALERLRAIMKEAPHLALDAPVQALVREAEDLIAGNAVPTQAQQ